MPILFPHYLNLFTCVFVSSLRMYKAVSNTRRMQLRVRRCKHKLIQSCVFLLSVKSLSFSFWRRSSILRIVRLFRSFWRQITIIIPPLRPTCTIDYCTGGGPKRNVETMKNENRVTTAAAAKVNYKNTSRLSLPFVIYIGANCILLSSYYLQSNGLLQALVRTY